MNVKNIWKSRKYRSGQSTNIHVNYLSPSTVVIQPEAINIISFLNFSKQPTNCNTSLSPLNIITVALTSV